MGEPQRDSAHVFLICSFMPDDRETLSPAIPEDVRDALALAFALTHDGKRQFRTSGEMMAKITARHLLEHLERSGFVLMKEPPAKMVSTSPHQPRISMKD